MPTPQFEPYSPNRKDSIEKQVKHLQDAYIESSEYLQWILQHLDSGNVKSLKTDRLIAGDAKISTALIESLVVGGNVGMGTATRSFTSQPVPPYHVGDFWTDGTTMRRCTTSREEGNYNAADWTVVLHKDATGIVTIMDGTINADYVNALEIYARKIVTAEGTQVVYIEGGTIRFNAFFYGVDSVGVPTLFLIPGMGLMKIKTIQDYDDNTSYSHTPGFLTLGQIYDVKTTNFSTIGGTAAVIISGNGIVDTGFLTVTGTKSCLQKTEHYGERLINAYETAEYYFGDIGYAVIGEDGEVVIHIDEIFQECVNTEIAYHVFTQVYNGSISSIERFTGYFIVHGTPGTEFSWEIKAKRRGYEINRLETFDSGEQIIWSNIENELNYIESLENTLLGG